MHPILLYILKMFLCSGILYGYYRVALYNERFHQWNRFYLLASLLLSIVVPLVEIPLIAEEQPVGLVYIIETFPTVVVTKSAPLFTTAGVIWMIALLISVILLFRLVIGMYKTLYKPLQEGQVTSLNEVSIILTEAQSAPYSFFKWLFWRSDMEPDSPHGKRVLEHELTHIRELHSIDKLLMEFILIACWFNPFFWLIKKELYVIHEFLADHKAIAHNDGAAFAEMILNTMNSGYPSAVANPFFSSQLKRRLKMITTSNKAQYSYLRRISGLIAMVGISLLLMLTIEKGMAQQAPPPPPPPPVAPPPPPPPPRPKVALPDSIKTIDVNTENGKSVVTIRFKNGTVRKMPVNEAIKKGYPVPPPPPPAPQVPAAPLAPEVKLSFKGLAEGEEPLIIYAGIAITSEQAAQIDPNNIESIDVLKGEKAIAAHGAKGKYGVINIWPKKQPANGTITEKNEGGGTLRGQVPGKPTMKEVVVIGYSNKPAPAFVLNGEVIDDATYQKLDPNDIKVITVLKGTAATDKYGDQGKNGVIEITHGSNLKGAITNPQKSSDPYDKVFTKLEKAPVYPGGNDAWARYLQKNLRFPDEAFDLHLGGTVEVEFVIAKTGEVVDIKVVKSPHMSFSKEAVRLIADGGNWEPGQQNNRVVNARVTQTIIFRQDYPSKEKEIVKH